MMKFNRIFDSNLCRLSLFFLVFITLSCGGEKKKQKIAILNFDISRNIDQSTAVFLENEFIKNLAESGKFDIVNHDQFELMILNHKKSNTATANYEAKQKTMKENGIIKLISGSAVKINEASHVSVKVLDKNLTVDMVFNGFGCGREKLGQSIRNISEKIKNCLTEKNKAQNSSTDPDILKAGDTVLFEGIDFVYIPPGSFKMGALSTEPGCDIDEVPRHEIKISNGFWMSKYEITQEQWESIMGKNPSFFKDETKNPVETVSWITIQDFIKNLNDKSEREFRLPTEAEWEYACRAGTTTPFYFGYDQSQLDLYAWFGQGEDGSTHRVGQKLPNNWGLYDMHGNVWEWCQDWHNKEYYQDSSPEDPRGSRDGIFRIRRGGSWRQYSSYSRSASRDSRLPNFANPYTGFRLVSSR